MSWEPTERVALRTPADSYTSLIHSFPRICLRKLTSDGAGASSIRRYTFDTERTLERAGGISGDSFRNGALTGGTLTTWRPADAASVTAGASVWGSANKGGGKSIDARSPGGEITSVRRVAGGSSAKWVGLCAGGGDSIWDSGTRSTSFANLACPAPRIFPEPAFPWKCRTPMTRGFKPGGGTGRGRIGGRSAAGLSSVAGFARSNGGAVDGNVACGSIGASPSLSWPSLLGVARLSAATGVVRAVGAWFAGKRSASRWAISRTKVAGSAIAPSRINCSTAVTNASTA